MSRSGPQTRTDQRSLEQMYRDEFASSFALARRARGVLPDGVAHDSRYMAPFAPYFTRAQGSRKWDVDGREYVDFWSGHGSMLLGHGHPAVLAAVQAQLAKGTHLGGSHEVELLWGEQVVKMVPSAERVRFTSSGTEATLLALRLARAYTGKTKVVKFQGNFHGWHDNLMPGVAPPYETVRSPGILDAVIESTILLPQNDLDLLRKTLEGDADVAALIIEPSGGTWGVLPLEDGFLEGLRDLTHRHAVVLIFDEVITGFRYAPGGAQERFGVTPDLTTMAKILAGGLPGGGVAGRADIMHHLDHTDDPVWNRDHKIYHPGTYNANPLSATAGLTALRQIEDGTPCAAATEMGQNLRAELNRVLEQAGVNWLAYGEESLFHIYAGGPADPQPRTQADLCRLDQIFLRKGPPPEVVNGFRQAMLLSGVDTPGLNGWMMAAHTPEDVERTAKAVEFAVQSLRRDKLVK